MGNAVMIPLTAAARLLGLSYWATWNRVVSGQLHGAQLDSGRWLVDRADVQRLARERQAVSTAVR